MWGMHVIVGPRCDFKEWANEDNRRRSDQDWIDGGQVIRSAKQHDVVEEINPMARV